MDENNYVHITFKVFLMALYSARIPNVEAIQWFKNGDHPDDHVINNINSGRVVGRHSTHLHFTGGQVCNTCDNPIGMHGLLNKAAESNRIVVCPGDYIEYVRDRRGRTIHYKLWHRKEFEAIYALNTEGKI
ncbi:hypothetical protein PHABIO_471 [Pseudomonas phage Phabio]|uniref:Uncharacterized protein n=1 Tax=Pseudomonas phage Phabio TaxID=2006668 RepID=A0A1Y0SZY6_9CAUD|nr:hypothetical protein MZD05_gp448 [Pseudomonas phage Phabio]ARV77099.1 hypothetical protein PHABIO_471 [Pseudomonas phage Phabio]